MIVIKVYFYLIEIIKNKLRTIKSILIYPHVQIHTGVIIGPKCHFGKEVKIYKNSIIASSTIDDYSYIGHNTEIKNCTIGKYCSIAPYVKIGLGIHPVDKISTYPGFYSKNSSGSVKIGYGPTIIEHKPVYIGNDVWIGTNCLIMDGVVLGNGAVIAAGSIVTKNVEPYSIVGGVPAKIIKMRFSKDQINLLESFKWWDKGLEFCKKYAHLFLKPDDFFKIIKENSLDN